jgi:hypothetical protein
MDLSCLLAFSPYDLFSICKPSNLQYHHEVDSIINIHTPTNASHEQDIHGV